jgi:glycine betaine catabolism B
MTNASLSPAPLILECLEVRTETPTVKSFVLGTTAGQVLSHRPGQALTLALDVDGERLYRTFSIASAPSADGRVELTIKAHPQGRATRWLHRALQPGMQVEARGPVGRFVFDAGNGNGVGRPVALVSAGSGASPLMAMLRTLAVTAPETDIAWFHVARTPDEVLFGAEIEALQRRMPRLSAAVAVTRPEPGWFGFRGRPTRRLLSVAMPDFGRRDTYCCGPDGFMRTLALIHDAEGGDAGRFHIEHFGPVTPDPDAAAAVASPGGAPGSGEVYRVTFGGKAFEAAAGETILAAATRRQVVIPCGCASGLCGTCRVRRVSGTVTMRHNGGLSEAEEAQGFILACSSRPTSDVEIAL